MEAQALKNRGWSTSAIARHLGRDRKTIRAYLSGQREAGVRRSSVPDPLGPYRAYLVARFADNAHIWASALFDEVVALGYSQPYVSFARQLRLADLRPRCEACAGVTGRETIEIEHPPGEEIQWDWFHRRAPWGGTANVLLGSLAHSGRMRGVLAERVDQAHLVEAMDGVLRRHGGTPRIWRTDRLASVIVPGSRDAQASFAPVAKHYGAVVEPCRPRRGNRKGVVEAAVRFACGRWWRTLAAGNATEAQLSLDRFCATTADERLRPPGAIEEPPADGSRPRWPTVAERADAEVLLVLPAAPVLLSAGPVQIDTERHLVKVRGTPVHLPLKEFDVLSYMLRNVGRAFTRKELIDSVWGDDYFGDTKTLDVHIRRLRSKIEDDPSQPTILLNVRGLGFKFEAG